MPVLLKFLGYFVYTALDTVAGIRIFLEEFLADKLPKTLSIMLGGALTLFVYYGAIIFQWVESGKGHALRETGASTGILTCGKL
jgi:hypothetical protein